MPSYYSLHHFLFRNIQIVNFKEVAVCPHIKQTLLQQYNQTYFRRFLDFLLSMAFCTHLH